MNDFQQKDMSGVLFKNERKSEGDDYPDYQGSVTIKGTKYNLAAWINVGKKSGKKFMSLRVKPWDDTYQKSAPKSDPVKQQEPDFVDDSIPF